jgi:hypothetical protein
MAVCSVTDVPAEDFPQKKGREVDSESVGAVRGLNILLKTLNVVTPLRKRAALKAALRAIRFYAGNLPNRLDRAKFEGFTRLTLPG